MCILTLVYFLSFLVHFFKNFCGRKLQENFEKGALFYEGAQKSHKIMNNTMNTEIMNTFPKTFVQDCSYISIVFSPPPPLRETQLTSWAYGKAGYNVFDSSST